MKKQKKPFYLSQYNTNTKWLNIGNTLNAKFSNSQLNKLKSALKNGTEVTLNVSLKLTGNSNDETNFPHKLLSTDTQVS